MGIPINGTNNNDPLLTGTALDDDINGFGGGDVLFGLSGNDTLNGGTGVDAMFGGGDNDIYYVDDPRDYTWENGGEGYDQVLTSVSYTLVPGTEIERLAATNPSGTAAINLTGNEFFNIISGNNGNNVLDGAGGADMMYGWNGNDIYIVDNLNDVATEYAGQGTFDRVLTSVSYRLTSGSEIERLETTNPSGTALIDLTGNELNNTLVGNNGSNVLDGDGGSDTMYGGGGDDTYFVDNFNDIVNEALGQGANDWVKTSVTYSLRLGSEVEVLATSDLSGTAQINLTGNEFKNWIIGNSGSNVLDGGAGGDNMLGWIGNDFYIVDNFNDVVTEYAGQGTLDRVQTSVTYSLTAGSEIEVLETTNPSGTALIDLTGNEFNNKIIGNNGNNVLNGGGGLDTLIGSIGADTFVWSAVKDTALAGDEADVVTDFNRPQGDVIDLRQIDADGNPGNGDTAFTFHGFVNFQNGFFTGAGQIGYFATATDTYILLNTVVNPGANGIDFEEATIHLFGAHTPDANWFAL